jgi:hypothetical protein
LQNKLKILLQKMTWVATKAAKNSKFNLLFFSGLIVMTRGGFYNSFCSSFGGKSSSLAGASSSFSSTGMAVFVVTLFDELNPEE